MTTVVLQSFRTWDVPDWMRTAMASVAAWAQARGYDYRFMDDDFLRLVPDWARWRLRGQLPAVTDLARLIWARRVLDGGADRVIWADADLLVFDPARLDFAPGLGHACARQLHLYLHDDRSTEPRPGINNALMVFEAGDAFIDTYLDAALTAARGADALNMPHTLLGPVLLETLAARGPLPLIEGIGLFGPGLMEAVAAGGGALTREYLRHMRAPLVAANLGQALRALAQPARRAAFDDTYASAAARLLTSRGAVMQGPPADS